MKILFIGDIFGSPGRRVVSDHAADIIQSQGIDLAIANAENSAGGFGVTPAIADELFALGLDVLTTGNHVWDKREIYDYLNREGRLLRPANYAEGTPGRGMARVTARNGVECAVINLQGRTYMAHTDCPFRAADRLLESIPDVRVRFVDFHAEVTSEKMAMGWYLAGRATAVIGTHTHVPTADTRLLPGGTAYQTDCGMTGPYDSIIGVEKDPVIQRFLTSMPVRMETARGKVEMHSVIVDCDEATGRATSIRRLMIEGE